MDEQARYQSHTPYSQNTRKARVVAYDTQETDGVYYYANEALGNAQGGKSRWQNRFIILIALFLIFALGLSLLSAYGMRRHMISLKTSKQSEVALKAAPALAQAANQGQLAANKHFSLEVAASKGDRQSQKALSIIEIAKHGKPSVVAISTEQAITRGYMEAIMPVAGSGVIISDDGYIATNNHVVANANNIKVHLDNGQLYDALLIGTDELSDLAVIKITAKEGEKFVPAVFGDSASLEVGELAVAIGNPSGTLEGSVTAGIISALERNINVEGLDMSLLQTDAAINAGNSGGALFNSFGELIGINSAKLQSDGGRIFDGIAFAIPVNFARPILEDLTKYGYVKDRVQLGISGEVLAEGMARFMGIADCGGILIKRISPNGPADKAGLRSGDFIVAMNGEATTDFAVINKLKKEWKVGDAVKVSYFRNGSKENTELVLQAYVPEEVKQRSD